MKTGKRWHYEDNATSLNCVGKISQQNLVTGKVLVEITKAAGWNYKGNTAGYLLFVSPCQEKSLLPKRKDLFIVESLYSLVSSFHTHDLFVCFNLLMLGEHRFHVFHWEITVDSRLYSLKCFWWWHWVLTKISLI